MLKEQDEENMSIIKYKTFRFASIPRHELAIMRACWVG